MKAYKNIQSLRKCCNGARVNELSEKIIEFRNRYISTDS